MASRAELNLRAFAVGLDPATIYNDSKLEQQILFLEKNTYAVTGTKPTTTFTLSGAAGDGETMTIGSQVYTMKTALTGVIASGTLTSNATIPNDGDTVLIGDIRYIFKTTLDTGAALFQTITSGSNNRVEVLINSSAANALTNLKAAINYTGTPGTDYTDCKVANPYASGSTLTSTTLLVTRKFAGTDNFLGSVVATQVSSSATTLSWGAAQLTGGVNPVANEILIGNAATNSLDNIKDAINGTVVSGAKDSTYSSNTPRNQFVTAGAKNSTTVVIASTNTNSVGALATTETFANGAFTGTTLASGVAGMIAVAGDGTADSVAQVSGSANTSL